VNVLDRLDELEREATAGWWNFTRSELNGEIERFIVQPPQGIGDSTVTGRQFRYKDAALIALSRNHLRALIDLAEIASRAIDLDEYPEAKVPLNALMAEKGGER
jgi:hypothetical protein